MGRIKERKLVDEKPVLLLPSLAQALGLNEAIIVQQLHYWLTVNKVKERNFKDGYYWTYNSIGSWQTQFPFWCGRTIERMLWKLEADGIVVTGRHNKLNLDRTKWYRLDYDKLKEAYRIGQTVTMEDGNKRLSESDKMSQWLGQDVTMDKPAESDKMSPPIPETNYTKNTPETNRDTSSSSKDYSFKLKPPPPPEHFCKEHGCKFDKHEKYGKTWYSHKNGSGYCNEPNIIGNLPRITWCTKGKHDVDNEDPASYSYRGQPICRDCYLKGKGLDALNGQAADSQQNL